MDAIASLREALGGVSEDRLAMYGLLMIVTLRVLSELVRARRYGPRSISKTELKSLRGGEKEEFDAFAKGGKTPGTKRLVIIIAMFMILGTALTLSAYRVSVTPRERPLKMDFDALLRHFKVNAPRGLKARIWTDSAVEDVRNIVQTLEDEMEDVKLEVVTPNSASCVAVTESWSSSQQLSYDEDVDAWIRTRMATCGTSESTYDIVLIAYTGPQSLASDSLIMGTHRAAWIRLQASVDLTEVLRRGIRAIFAEMSELTSDHLAPFLATSDNTLLASFTLVNAAPTDGYSFSWDFERDVERSFLGNVAQNLQRLVDMKVESQVLRHAPSRLRPAWSETYKAYVVHSSQTPFFIDSDWPLDTSVTYTPVDGKPLHFVVYVPPHNECPLHLLNDDGSKSNSNSFMVEGWGGVMILNPPKCAQGEQGERKLNSEQISTVLNVLVQQLRSHLGVTERLQKNGMKILPPQSSGFADWEIDALVRSRLTSHAVAAISNLKSLDDVITSIGDIAVPEVIVELINTASISLQDTKRLLVESRYDEASLSATKAFHAAERAFFHPFSLGGLEAYPFEYKLASITPILLSTVLPTMLMLIREVNHFYVRKRCAARVRHGKTKMS
jgi:phosphatidylinositol glycan class S